MLSFHLLCFVGLSICIGNSRVSSGYNHVEEERIPCGKDEIRCIESGECIPEKWKCDGNPDCQDQTDELHCLNHIDRNACISKHGLFECSSDKNCISLDLVCDNKKDCADGSDEGGSCHEYPCRDARCKHWCHVTPTGPVCGCKDGYLLADDRLTCEDIDECSSYPPLCSQLCHNSPGGYECGCVGGFILDDNDGRSCRAVGMEAAMVYSTQRPTATIHQIGLRSGIEIPVAKRNMGEVTDVTLSVRQNRLYWIDNENARVLTSDRHGDKMTTIIQHGLQHPVAIEYEWRSHLLYVADTHTAHVYACVTDGSTCATIRDDVEGIVAMAMHPLLGMFYTSHCPHSGTTSPASVIRLHTLDGRRSVQFFPSSGAGDTLGCAASMAVDTVLHVLYWADIEKGTIEKAQLDGSGHMVLLQQEVHDPFGVAVFEDRIYWTDKEGTVVLSAHKFTGRAISVHVERSSRIRGFHVHHDNQQDSRGQHNPCWNNPCSHLCTLASATNFTCLCPEGMRLEGYKCRDDDDSAFLLISQGRHVLQLYPRSPGHHVEASWALDEGAQVVSLDYDPASNSAFVSDLHSDRILRLPLNWDESVSPVISDTLHTVESLAVDWISRNIYWVDITTREIQLSKIDGSSRLVLLRDLPMPRAIAILPTKGLMVYSDWSPQRPSIVRCLLNGQNCTAIMSDPRYVLRPVGVTMDAVSGRLFWADTGKRHVMAAGLDGSYPAVLASDVLEPFAVAVLADTVYWLAHNSTALHFASTYSSGGHRGVLYTSHTTIMSVLSVDKRQRNLGHNGCSLSHNACSHVCTPLPEDLYECHCPPGYVLSNDQHNCLDTDTCPESWFRCSDQKCIPLSQLCDGTPQCRDGEDELQDNCKGQSPVKMCGADYHFCTESRECVLLSYLCDDVEDCTNGEDEAPELCANKTCRADQFMCDGNRCHLNDYKCDGDPDCEDKSDEADCPCPAPSIQCQDSGLCIPVYRQCDGIADCEDGTDENTNCKAELVDGCSSQQYKCRSEEQCIPMSSVCDGFRDCMDGSDEDRAECSTTSTQSPTTQRSTGAPQPTNHRGNAISSWYAGENWCTESDYMCADNMECVPFNKVCDGRPDCKDASDEGRLCGASCLHKEECEHVCTPTPRGPVCSCPRYYKLNNDGKTCSKKKSCAYSTEEQPLCSHDCEETRTGYKCRCHPGYFLEHNGSCVAHVSDIMIGEGPNILYTNDRYADIMYYIYDPHHHTDPGVLRHFPAGTPTTFDVDMDADSRKVVYYDLTKGSIVSTSLSGAENTPVATRVPHCDRLAVDWVAHNVYYTDSSTPVAIWVCKLAERDMCVKLVEDGLDKPRAIALYPAKGQLWWTDWGERAVIMSAWMDGSHIAQVVSEGLGWPNGLAVDMERDRLYWADAMYNSIEVSRLDGSDRRVIGSTHQEVLHPNNLVVFEDYVYWTDWASKSINRFNKFSGNNFSKVLSRASEPRDMKILHTVLQPESVDPCAAMSCESLCLLSPEGATCRCSSSQQPRHGADHTTCTDLPSLGTGSSVAPASTSIPAPSAPPAPATRARSRTTPTSRPILSRSTLSGAHVAPNGRFSATLKLPSTHAEHYTTPRSPPKTPGVPWSAKTSSARDTGNTKSPSTLITRPAAAPQGHDSSATTVATRPTTTKASNKGSWWHNFIPGFGYDKEDDVWGDTVTEPPTDRSNNGYWFAWNKDSSDKANSNREPTPLSKNKPTTTNEPVSTTTPSQSSIFGAVMKMLGFSNNEVTDQDTVDEEVLNYLEEHEGDEDTAGNQVLKEYLNEKGDKVDVAVSEILKYLEEHEDNSTTSEDDVLRKYLKEHGGQVSDRITRYEKANVSSHEDQMDYVVIDDCPIECDNTTICVLINDAVKCICPDGDVDCIEGTAGQAPHEGEAVPAQKPNNYYWVYALLGALVIGVVAAVIIVFYWHRRTGTYTTELQFKYNDLKAKENGTVDSFTSSANAYENPIYREHVNKEQAGGGNGKKHEVGELLSGSDESLDAHFAQDPLMYAEQPTIRRTSLI